MKACRSAHACDWWRGCLQGEEPVGLCDVVVFGFVRLIARRGVFAQPLPVNVVVDLVA